MSIPNSPETILPKLELVRDALEKNNINVQVEAAAEYMVDLDLKIISMQANAC
jgi:hypothetical protein